MTLHGVTAHGPFRDWGFEDAGDSNEGLEGPWDMTLFQEQPAGESGFSRLTC